MCTSKMCPSKISPTVRSAIKEPLSDNSPLAAYWLLLLCAQEGIVLASAHARMLLAEFPGCAGLGAATKFALAGVSEVPGPGRLACRDSEGWKDGIRANMWVRNIFVKGGIAKGSCIHALACADAACILGHFPSSLSQAGQSLWNGRRHSAARRRHHRTSIAASFKTLYWHVVLRPCGSRCRPHPTRPFLCMLFWDPVNMPTRVLALLPLSTRCSQWARRYASPAGKTRWPCRL